MKYLITFILSVNGVAGLAAGDIVFYVNDQAGFSSATNSLDFLGTEDFESSTLSTGQIGRVDDPLAPGVANGPLPNGTNPNLGMTIQSNVLAGNSSMTSPLGFGGLAQYADGFGSSPTDQLTTTFQFHSLDLIFAGSPEAVSLLPLFVDTSSNPNLRGNIELEVYDTTNTLVGSTMVPDVSFLLTDVEVGIVATDGTKIGRINVFDGSLMHWQGVDDVKVFASSAVPEPNTSFLVFALVIGTAVTRKKSQQRKAA